MADGGQTIDQSEVIERAARRLARAMGTAMAGAQRVLSSLRTWPLGR